MELYSLLSYYFTQMFIFNSIKSLYAALLIAFAAFFAPIATLGHVLVLVIIFDFIKGILASKKRKEPILSRKMSRSIYKLLLYSLFLLVLYSLEVVLFGRLVPITKVGFGLILLAETKSGAENMDTIFNTNIFKSIYAMIKKSFGIITKNKLSENGEEKETEKPKDTTESKG